MRKNGTRDRLHRIIWIIHVTIRMILFQLVSKRAILVKRVRTPYREQPATSDVVDTASMTVFNENPGESSSDVQQDTLPIDESGDPWPQNSSGFPVDVTNLDLNPGGLSETIASTQLALANEDCDIC